MQSQRTPDLAGEKTKRERGLRPLPAADLVLDLLRHRAVPSLFY